MGLMSIEELYPNLACPRCQADLIYSHTSFHCSDSTCDYSSGKGFSIINGLPILVDFENSILNEHEVAESFGASPIHRRNSYLGKKIREALFSVNDLSEKNAALFRKLLKEEAQGSTILIIGGAMITSKIDNLYTDHSLKVISFDIYKTSLVNFIADGHQIPLHDQSVDGVWIQAVLEHVLDPWLVVSEIYRVLKPDGYVYAETPFLQQVHSGPYDFTRFTESGHRWLFRKFLQIDSGVTQGPGTQLLWTIDHVSRSIFRSQRAGLIMKTLMFWTRYIDLIAARDYAVDSASGVFFLGRKTDKEVRPSEMVEYYNGAQRIKAAKL